MPTSNVYAEIYARVREIPAGTLSSYGMVAAAVGRRRGAQMVGWALAALPHTTDVPWQRVVNKEARLTIVNRNFAREHQRDLLVNEGVTVDEDQYGFFLPNPPWHQFS